MIICSTPPAQELKFETEPIFANLAKMLEKNRSAVSAQSHQACSNGLAIQVK